MVESCIYEWLIFFLSGGETINLLPHIDDT